MNASFSYKAAAYARASKDDIGSGTIENQIELIREHVRAAHDISIVSIREDNGFSGVDFLRPAFIEMMKDIESGSINCVIVKDLSRLGRNYIEVGELLDVTFPKYNVRIIAVNDRFDSLNPRSDADYILLPFKNLINEQYLRDFSRKIRSSLEVKRRKGEFVAAFAVYGYKRDENDKHKLVIDEYAASVVKKIFRLRIEGMSNLKIAERLNADGEPSPADYKKRSTNYVGTFQTKEKTSWTNVSVARILTNRVYIGDMIQGKYTTPSYKVKKRIQRPENEWHIIPNSHEPIVSERDFETVSLLLMQDTRAKANSTSVYPLAGFLYCADCGNSMVRSMSGKYTYYVCASSIKKGFCKSHCILDKKLEVAVFSAIKTQIALAAELEKVIDAFRLSSERDDDFLDLEAQITDRENEINACEQFKGALYDDYKNGVISKDDFVSFNNSYTSRIKSLQKAADRLRKESEALSGGSEKATRQLKYAAEFKNIPEFNRQAVVSFVKRIEISAGKRISIEMRFRDRLEAVQDVLNDAYALKEGCLSCGAAGGLRGAENK